ncbi:MAG TPA: nucleotidyltransferase [Actinomycetota bacterium]|jgi:hypothetical protein
MASDDEPRGPDYDFADEEQLLEALDGALDALRSASIPFLVMGGIASAVVGRPRWTRDVDLFVRPEDAERTLRALEAGAFATEVQDRHWLGKARLGEITVDVIWRSTPDILLDDEMLERGVSMEFKGRTIPLVPPEDLVVMKTMATSEDTPRYWYDALSILARVDLDWSYLVRRARASGVRRVLAVLLFAQSLDLAVPSDAIRSLFELVDATVLEEPTVGTARDREVRAS